ncbi:MAG: hypothetical protein C0608_00390 [Deltaproteobacteria bacterium]|nr:MAG: hypothetical protein C0608_00390 [Deltaproteobacteria bacterium]
MKQLNESSNNWWATGEGVTLGGGVINVVIGFIKFFAGSVGGSPALLADALHSFSDLATDIVVLLGYRIGRAPEDDKHPWGHGKIETLATLIMGVVISVLGVGMAIDAVINLTGEPSPTPPGIIALGAALLSIVGKEGLFRWTAWVARGTDSRLILSNAWHHRTDSLSSIAALLGVWAARNGFWWGDPLAVIVVSLFIVKVGADLLLPAYQDLTDASVEDETLIIIEETLGNIQGVKGYHNVRARRAGAELFIDIDIEVDGGLNVIQGHDVARAVKTALLTGVKGTRDVMVHIEPIEARVEVERRELLQKRAAEIALETQGVLGVHGVRLIPDASGCLINIDIEVSPDLIIKEAHEIAHNLKYKLKELEGVGDAVIHVDLHGDV